MIDFKLVKRSKIKEVVLDLNKRTESNNTNYWCKKVYIKRIIMLSLKIKQFLKIRKGSLITVLVKVLQRNRNKIYISQLTKRASQREILFYWIGPQNDGGWQIQNLQARPLGRAGKMVSISVSTFSWYIHPLMDA